VVSVEVETFADEDRADIRPTTPPASTPARIDIAINLLNRMTRRFFRDTTLYMVRPPGDLRTRCISCAATSIPKLSCGYAIMTEK